MPSACGQLVACGTGTVILHEIEDAGGTRLSGPALSDQPWTGRHWE
jgi:hypothetical protein